jgi:hypothetical protein
MPLHYIDIIAIDTLMPLILRHIIDISIDIIDIDILMPLRYAIMID